MRRIATLLLTLIPLALCAQDQTAEPENLDATPRFVFEGDVNYVDPVLRADIGPPRVLSGTMQLGALKGFHNGVVVDDDGEITNTFSGNQMVIEAEYTLDRNYVISYQAWFDPGVSNAVTMIDGESNEEEDLIGFRFGVAAESTTSSGYTATSIGISLRDEKGKMIDSNAPFYSPPAYQEATFELNFINPETGEEAKATGTITMFANLDADVTPEEDYHQLEKQILALDTLLEAKQAEAEELQQLLDTQAAELKRRDAIIAEFQANQKKLLAENEQLRSGEEFKRMQETNAELRAQLENTQGAREFSAAAVAQMTVRQQMLAEDNAELAESNAALRKQLANTLAEMSNLRGRQELLTRQSEKQFEYDLPPLPEPSASKQQNLPLASVSNSSAASTAASTEAPPPPASTLSLREMALAAAQDAQTVQATNSETSEEREEATAIRQDKIPPGQVSSDLKPTAVVDPEEAKGTWSFALPMVAATPQEPAASPPAPRTEPEREAETNSRVERRGPRR